MGNASSTRTGPEDTYAKSLATDVSALLDHLDPNRNIDRLFVSGGSYGTVAAQILYGAPYDVFPQGEHLSGCMIIAGMSPFKYHTDYAKTLILPNWISVGPPSQLIPFHLLQRCLKYFIKSKISTLEGAASFLSSQLFDKMDPDEQAKFDEFLAAKHDGEPRSAFITNMAKGVRKSAANWDGFMEVSDVLHSDWGFDPRGLDEEHARKPMLVVGSDEDALGLQMNEWMVRAYKGAEGMTVPGGHISGLFYLDELWERMLEMGGR